MGDSICNALVINENGALLAALVNVVDCCFQYLIRRAPGNSYVSALNFALLDKIFGSSRSAVVLGGAVSAGYQITLFYDPNSKKEWNYLGSQLLCWLQSPSATFDRPVHGPVVLFNEQEGELKPLTMRDLETLKKLLDQRERGAEHA